MIAQTFDDIYTDELAKDAIYNNEWPGFFSDYLILHILIKKYKPQTFFEVGTNMGSGTKIICNAVYDNKIKEGDKLIFAPVCSLDLPFEQLHPTLVRGEKDIVGINCTFPFTQLRGDSMTFDYSKYPCEGYFIDGEHDYEHPYKETIEILKLEPKLIVWHDSDIPEVYNAISVAFYDDVKYDLFRVTNTRIAYAIKKEL